MAVTQKFCSELSRQAVGPPKSPPGNSGRRKCTQRDGTMTNRWQSSLILPRYILDKTSTGICGSAVRHFRLNALTVRSWLGSQVKPPVTSHNTPSHTKPACGIAKLAWSPRDASFGEGQAEGTAPNNPTALVLISDENPRSRPLASNHTRSYHRVDPCT